MKTFTAHALDRNDTFLFSFEFQATRFAPLTEIEGIAHQTMIENSWFGAGVANRVGHIAVQS